MDQATPGAQERLQGILSALTGLSDADYEHTYRMRLERFQRALLESNVDAAVLTLGAEVPWLIGYEPMPLERITALVVRPNEGVTLLVPRLEAARVKHRSALFNIVPWSEAQDPFAEIQNLTRGCNKLAVSDRGWSSWLLHMMSRMGSVSFSSLGDLGLDLRREKDDIELLTLSAASAAADVVANLLLSGEIELVGRSEEAVSEELGRLLVDFGHSKVNFAIVGSGPNSASPHHEPSSRVIQLGEPVVCDFGGTFSVNGEPGYCSDITRTVHTGPATEEFRELYEVLHEAQSTARRSITTGMELSAADRTARKVIESHGYGEYFIHRLGHGIGMEEHEEPYLVSTAGGVIKERDCFSIEPGIYLNERMGARIEDIVTVEGGTVRSLNLVSRDLVEL
ncbi:Xaa-Pro aminopeptidase [Ferrithrix thermotolerans DSM 19514]|uniref:Xaa-Pro aminopeptidase n=1 Tax=Ferrithrix thermotolerans DSM 19514 TaxID=1121881 RepID=A0A1M4V765_9ACTN|nr:aminopeptidase P family protein [Ferrithrix thermotolerans]SHE64740.1 Xaa-Pro aminopeptidase [Ferrithrix thermotolerans DSM 19514]